MQKERINVLEKKCYFNLWNNLGRLKKYTNVCLVCSEDVFFKIVSKAYYMLGQNRKIITGLNDEKRLVFKMIILDGKDYYQIIEVIIGDDTFKFSNDYEKMIILK